MTVWDQPVESNWRAAGLRPIVIAAALVAAIAVSFRHHEPLPPGPHETQFAAPRHQERLPVAAGEPSSDPIAIMLPSRSDVQAQHRRPRTVRPQTHLSEEVVDFIPLGPLTPGDVSHSFQIVPVRINNAPAHLLLGEDGIAQGILWRSR